MEKSTADIAWVLVCAGLVFLMQAGFLCLESGLTRSKNSINVAAKNLADFGVAVLVYWMVGFGLMFGISANGWIGTSDFLTRVGQGGAWHGAFFVFQLMFCATAATIVSGAVAERMRFFVYILLTVLVTGLIYPLFGHWAWGGLFGGMAGWLGQRGFVDFAGSTVVHSVGGWVALAAVLLVGPREGRFPSAGPPRTIQGSNLPIAMLGVLLLILGWFGFNGGSTLAMNLQVPGVIANTLLAASAGMVTAMVVAWKLRGRPDVHATMNGVLAGLVAITANCHAVTVGSAVIIGSVGALVMLGASYLLERRRIDDAVGAIPVHLAAGMWGTLAVGLFGIPDALGTGLDRWAQIGVQMLGVVSCGLVSFGLAYGILRIVSRVVPLRVSREEERAGMNMTEHGATTEFIELVSTMAQQAKTRDVSLRVPVEPFTEVGQVAAMYNRVMSVLERTLRLKDEFVAKVSHELRTPLTSIKEGVSLMRDGALGDTTHTQQEFLNTVDQDIDRLTELVNNMLDLSKAESGHLRLSRRRVSLQQVLDEAVRSYRPLLGTRTVTKHMTASPLGFVDPDAMQQVFGNLLSNAVKYTRPDGIVTLHLAQQGATCTVAVEDNGTGISTPDLERLFQKFSQVGARDPNQPRGTGLGLALCKQLVEMHGGQITAASTLGRGSTFTATLPIYSDGLALRHSLQEMKNRLSFESGQSIALLAIDASRVLGRSGDVQSRRDACERLTDAVRAKLHQGDIVLDLDSSWVVAFSMIGKAGPQTILRRLQQSLPESPSLRFGAAVCPTDGEEVELLVEHAVRMARMESSAAWQPDASPSITIGTSVPTRTLRSTPHTKPTRLPPG